MKKLELLAPAGNILKMKTAFAHGADAVYLGLPDFSLRVRINDFGMKEIREAVKYARQEKKRVYVTINIFAHNKHFRKLPAYIKELKKMKIDALIISDPGVIALVKKVWPQAAIHLSTQANCTNASAAAFWFKQGVSRVILGREVTLEEIKEIHKLVPKLELEYFVHGAMCMAYSGRCFLSKLMLDRSANLGDCAQPCRWEYDTSRYALKTGNHEEEFELVEERHGAYLLNSRDLCLIKYLPQLIAAGVTSFKIEGRAKSVYYQATIVGAYRRALNLSRTRIAAPRLRKELDYLFSELEDKLVHRGYTNGFLLGGKADQNITDSHQNSAWEFCGQVIGFRAKKDGRNELLVQVHNTLKAGDELEIIKPGYDIIKLRPLIMKDAKTGQDILEAHGGGGSQIAAIEWPVNLDSVPEFSVLRRKI